MRKKTRALLLLILLTFLMNVPASHATMPTFDAVNAALQELQNAILNSNFAQDLVLAAERLSELKSQTLELFRFHSGLDDILDSVIGDPLSGFLHQGKASLRDAFIDTGLITPQIEIIEGAQGPSDIRHALEQITGEIPQGNQRPYIPFEDMMVVDAFDLAREIREAGISTRTSADSIAEQAKAASPKGAVRLQAQGVAQLMLLGQQNQEAMAKLLELNATKIEQVTRVEKAAEGERIQYLKDANQFLEDHFASLN